MRRRSEVGELRGSGRGNTDGAREEFPHAAIAVVRGSHNRLPPEGGSYENAVADGVARHLRRAIAAGRGEPPWTIVNDVAGFIGPEVFTRGARHLRLLHQAM